MAAYEKDDIIIIAGEGEVGTAQYSPELSVSPEGISARLEAKRCNGDRWAQAIRFAYDSDGGPVGIDVETGNLVVMPEFDDLA